MNAIDLLLTRGSARRLTDPGPDSHSLERILQAAVSAPDHGRLRPWRFVVIQGESRGRFGDILAESLRRSRPDAEPELLLRERAKAFRAPVIIVVAARPAAQNNKIPEIEQILAVGAAAENIMLAAHALGFGAMWKTGQAAYEAQVKSSLGLESTDHIVGFLYIGTRAEGDSSVSRADAQGSRIEFPA